MGDEVAELENGWLIWRCGGEVGNVVAKWEMRSLSWRTGG